ncbi:hypothetical protein [Bradyrhizobium cenepequi]|uniref:hypothetical protein n=1 Tax=Bradyrhizobium cenepequi TaxID=2821403 RepID=UPI001CE2B5FD|nr:hypothetical protein [Bradyrhizobium cenepequi]MCA6109475.1 hypothetical protein [Bradyrhizobium cenepequi]
MEQGQPQWSRETPWRQGHVLCAIARAVLELHHADTDATCVVVISHDCDLANDDLHAEPHVEVIVGRVVSAPNGNFSWGKAPRTLHLSMQRDGAPVIVELVTTSKRLVPKSALASFEPDGAFVVDGKGLKVLRSWLSARYDRAAFPDAFVRRMQKTKVDERLAKKLEPHGALISFVYFDLDGGLALERPDGEPYDLSIVLVYHPGDNAEASADTADELAEAVQEACEARLMDKKQIVIKRCIAISEDDLPVSKARVLTHWRLEHMTLRADDDQPGPI